MNVYSVAFIPHSHCKGIEKQAGTKVYLESKKEMQYATKSIGNATKQA